MNRIKGLLYARGISGYKPLKRDRRVRLEELKTGDGRAMPSGLKAEILRIPGRIELLLEQIKDVGAIRDRNIAEEKNSKAFRVKPESWGIPKGA